MSAEPDPKIDARRLLAELDLPHAEGRRKQAIEHFADGVDALMGLLQEAGGPSKGGGELAFAINHLLARSVSDLVTGMHLASHAYLQQAHSVIRPVIESLDLIDLFAQQPELAERWVNSEAPGKEFAPKQVREKLDKKDETAAVYGHFSEVGPHPRFAGASLMGGMVPGNDDESDTALFRIGPYFPDHPKSLHPYLWALTMLVDVGFKARHLELVSDEVTFDDWLQHQIEVVKAVGAGCRELRAEFVEMGAGEDSEWLETHFDELLAKLEAGPAAEPDV